MTIGAGTKTASPLKTSEPYLVSIGKNVTISHDVDLITHDNSVCKLFGVGHDLFGRVIIGDNCFLGAHSVIMYGVTIADNVIVAAGSVVTKSIEESHTIVAGNPARIIGKWDTFREKNVAFELCTWKMSKEEKRKYILDNENRLIKR